MDTSIKAISINSADTALVMEFHPTADLAWILKTRVISKALQSNVKIIVSPNHNLVLYTLFEAA